jgi:hypothetical protein
VERGDEEAAQESTRRGPRQAGWFGPERGQTAGQPRKWPQGWPGQKPQEETCSPAQCSTAATRTAQEGVNAAIASIRARFGDYAIGLGYSGIRFAAPALY